MSESTQPGPAPAGSAERKAPKGRSPSYPGITLQVAIDRARALYDHEKTHPTPIQLVAGHWGYKKHTTGPASVTYAALIKYGLMSDEGTGDARQAKLTDLAVKILHSPDPAERQAGIREAALKPTIHAEMWNTYGTELPSEDALKYKMAITGPFTENGFDEFIRVYKETVAFAKLAVADKIEPSETDRKEEDGGGDDGSATGEKPQGPKLERKDRAGRVGMSGTTQTIAVPMIGAPAVMIEGQFPLSERDWNYFLTVLAAMKPGLVAGPDQRDGDE